MSTTTTLTATMAELKSEPAHGAGLWPNYSSSVPLSSRFPNPMESSLPHVSSGSSQHRPRGSVPGIDTQYSYPRYSQEDTESFDRHSQQASAHYGGYPSTPKRSYSQSEQHPHYQEMVQDLRDDGSKLTVNHDHKLLSFRRLQDKHTIVDQQGRIQQLELSAQLHGMFFLSEMPSSTTDGAMLQPELTCYRRNLFQISGSLVTPRGQLSVIQADTGETVPVSNTEVTISAIESVDGHPVRLIVIPWKTPPPNSPELPQTADQEPPPLPLIPFPDDGQEADGEYAVYPIGWRRLQFRIATANNGRRKELQQHFVLHLKVMGTLTNGTKVVLTESTTAPVVVRGRSPRNFQARKEIPLLGSSAGSRGQALVETGLGIVAGPLSAKPQDPKMRGLNMELPRTAFTFNASKIPGSSMGMRSNSYPTWNSSSQLPMSQMPASATASYPPSTMSNDPYQKMPLSAAPSFSAEPQDMSLQSSAMPMPLGSTDQQANSSSQHQQPGSGIRTQYAYVPSASSTTGDHQHGLNVPRYVDQNHHRPTKSPRHGSHPSIHSTSSLTNDPSSSEYRYGPSAYSTGAAGDTASTAYGAGGSASGVSEHNGNAPPHTPSQQHPPPPSTPSQTQLQQNHRDYPYTAPAASSWAGATTTADSNASGSIPAYHNGVTGVSASNPSDSRSSYVPPPLQTRSPTQHSHSQSQHAASSHHHQHHHQPPPAAPGAYHSNMNHYSWSST